MVLALLLIIFTFGQLTRVNVLPDVTIHVNDLVVGAVGGIGIIRNIRKVPKAWWLWIGAMAVSLLVNMNRYPVSQLMVAGMYGIRWIAYAGVFLAVRDMEDVRCVGKWLRLAALAVAILGIGQYLLLPNTSFLAEREWDEHYFRLISTFLDPGFTGIILVLGILSALSNLRILSVLFTALLFTYSRASYLAYLVGFAVVSWYKKSFNIIIVATLVLLVCIPLLPKTFGEGTKLGRENSAWARINNWKQAISVWQTAPVFGIGFNAYRYATNASVESHAGAGSDSSLLTVLATTGVMGLIAYLGVLRQMWVLGKTSLVFKASFMAVIIHSWFNNTLFYPWVMEWLWLLLATRENT